MQAEAEAGLPFWGTRPPRHWDRWSTAIAWCQSPCSLGGCYGYSQSRCRLTVYWIWGCWIDQSLRYVSTTDCRPPGRCSASFSRWKARKSPAVSVELRRVSSETFWIFRRFFLCILFGCFSFLFFFLFLLLSILFYFSLHFPALIQFTKDSWILLRKFPN